jgi:hypothetical protein
MLEAAEWLHPIFSSTASLATVGRVPYLKNGFAPRCRRHVNVTIILLSLRFSSASLFFVTNNCPSVAVKGYRLVERRNSLTPMQVAFLHF